MNNIPKQEDIKVNEKKIIEKQKFVQYSEYMQLKHKFEEMKRKNREMTNLIKSMNKSILQVSESYSTINSIYNTLVKVDEMKHFFNQSSNNLSSKQTDQSLKAENESNSSLTKQRTNFDKDLKKLEELEFYLSEMTKNYNYIVIKYKYMKMEKEKVDELNIQYIQENGQLREKITQLDKQITQLENSIEKDKFVERCLLNSINSLYQNSERQILDNRNRDSEKNKVFSEPIPSFIKFMKG
jgi:hypothetical protein